MVSKLVWLNLATGNSHCRPRHTFLVYLTNDPDAAETELETFAEKHQIKNIPLTMFDGEAGPPKHNIAKDAEVTIRMWKDKEVKVNHAFAANSLDKRP